MTTTRNTDKRFAVYMAHSSEKKDETVTAPNRAKAQRAAVARWGGKDSDYFVCAAR